MQAMTGRCEQCGHQMRLHYARPISSSWSCKVGSCTCKEIGTFKVPF